MVALLLLLSSGGSPGPHRTTLPSPAAEEGGHPIVVASLRCGFELPPDFREKLRELLVLLALVAFGQEFAAAKQPLPQEADWLKSTQTDLELAVDNCLEQFAFSTHRSLIQVETANPWAPERRSSGAKTVAPVAPCEVRKAVEWAATVAESPTSFVPDYLKVAESGLSELFVHTFLKSGGSQEGLAQLLREGRVEATVQEGLNRVLIEGSILGKKALAEVREKPSSHHLEDSELWILFS
jgi:hypothetical protein